MLPSFYNIIRVDRSSKTHPCDPKFPKKFRKNGGGVLIAYRTDIDISVSKLSLVSCQAELLSVVLKFPNDEKLCVSTVYRVGTLGFDNFREIKKHLEILAKKQKLNKHFLVGDINFSEVAWPEGSTSCELHRSFLEFFSGDLGHVQMISAATHKSGNVLDLLFTNVAHIIEDIAILDQNEVFLSDHKGITLKVKLQRAHKKKYNHIVYDFSKAKWRDLNFDIKHSVLITSDLMTHTLHGIYLSLNLPRFVISTSLRKS